jgi:hypothetical protein
VPTLNNTLTDWYKEEETARFLIRSPE